MQPGRARGAGRSRRGARPARTLLAGAAAALALSCAAAPVGAAPREGFGSHHRARSSATTHGHRHRDPETAGALLRIARAFNLDFAHNKDAAVYARWDAASRAVISRTAFLRRHRQCPNPPESHVDTYRVTRGPHHEWLVHYSVGGIQFVDYWYYVHGRFVFDLPKSNPSAVTLYRSSPAAYAKAVGCNH